MLLLSDATHALFDRIADICGEVWTIDDAMACADSFGYERVQVRQLHARLEGSGMIVRLRRGVYAWPATTIAQGAPAAWRLASLLVPRTAISHRSSIVAGGTIPADPIRDRTIISVTTRSTVARPARRAECRMDEFLAGTPAGNVAPPRLGQGRHLDATRRHAHDVAGLRFAYVQCSPAGMFGHETIDLDGIEVVVQGLERAVLACFQHEFLDEETSAASMLTVTIEQLDLDLLAAHAARLGNESVTLSVVDALNHIESPWADAWRFRHRAMRR